MKIVEEHDEIWCSKNNLGNIKDYNEANKKMSRLQLKDLNHKKKYTIWMTICAGF